MITYNGIFYTDIEQLQLAIANLSEEQQQYIINDFNGVANAASPTALPDVTPRQIRQALILSGVTMSSIEAALATLPSPMKELAQTEWEYSISFQRNRPLVSSVGQMLGWTPEQLDSLWVFAGTL